MLSIASLLFVLDQAGGFQMPMSSAQGVSTKKVALQVWLWKALSLGIEELKKAHRIEKVHLKTTLASSTWIML